VREDGTSTGPGDGEPGIRGNAVENEKTDEEIWLLEIRATLAYGLKALRKALGLGTDPENLAALLESGVPQEPTPLYVPFFKHGKRGGRKPP
jgi:hypothetical protein